jgi:hypothetical protein
MYILVFLLTQRSVMTPSHLSPTGYACVPAHGYHIVPSCEYPSLLGYFTHSSNFFFSYLAHHRELYPKPLQPLLPRRNAFTTDIPQKIKLTALL